MRFYLLLVLIILSGCALTGKREPVQTQKEFEGIVKYAVELKSKTSNISTENLQNIYGDQLTFYYKEGNYKMVYNGELEIIIFYISKENLQYTLAGNKDTLMISDCSYEPSKLISSVLLDKKERILNVDCQVLRNELDDGRIYTYSFDNTKYMDPQHFKEHHFAYVDVYYRKSEGLMMKFKNEGISFDLIHTAIEVESKKIDPEEFIIPELPRKKLSE